MYKINC